MITLTDYWMGRDLTHSLEMSPGIEDNALRLLTAVNALLTVYPGVRPKVSSGWRPPSYNATVSNAAKRSKHMTGQAIDLEDDEGELDDWCFQGNGFPLLSQYGLWLEHPASTKGWCHLQSVPPKSGNRVFYP